jgi:hypothetical protein
MRDRNVGVGDECTADTELDGRGGLEGGAAAGRVAIGDGDTEEGSMVGRPVAEGIDDCTLVSRFSWLSVYQNRNAKIAAITAHPTVQAITIL